MTARKIFNYQKFLQIMTNNLYNSVIFVKKKDKSSILAHTSNPTNRKPEAGRSSVWDQLELQSEFMVILSKGESLSQKQTKITRQTWKSREAIISGRAIIIDIPTTCYLSLILKPFVNINYDISIVMWHIWK
jgi:hypothetical protein